MINLVKARVYFSVRCIIKQRLPKIVAISILQRNEIMTIVADCRMQIPTLYCTLCIQHFAHDENWWFFLLALAAKINFDRFYAFKE